MTVKMIVYFDDFDSVSVDQSEKMMSCLLPFYREKVERSKKKEIKKQRMIAYMLLQYCITREYPEHGVDEFSYEKYGKPYIEGAKYHFNYTHTKSAVACAVSRSPIGIDAQDVVADYKKIMRKACSESEIQWLELSRNPKKDFITLWALKEAYVKQKGTGIWDSIHQLDFSGRYENKWKQWNKYFYVVKEENYVIAVCSEEKGQRVKKLCLSDLFI